MKRGEFDAAKDLTLAAAVTRKDALRDTDHSVAPRLRKFVATLTRGTGKAISLELEADNIQAATRQASALLVGSGSVTVESAS